MLSAMGKSNFAAPGAGEGGAAMPDGKDREEKKLFKWGLYAYLKNRGGDQDVSITKKQFEELQSWFKGLLNDSFVMTNDRPTS